MKRCERVFVSQIHSEYRPKSGSRQSSLEALQPWSRKRMVVTWTSDFPCSSVVKNPPANAGDSGLIPGLGRLPGEESGNPLFAWEIPWTEESGGLQSMGLRKSQTRLSD